MRTLTSISAVAAAVCIAWWAILVPPAQAGSPQEFVRLYNGKDLSGWEVQGGKIDAWKADGPMLSCVGPGGGWLRTARQYSDFVLRLEYRLPPGGNSGVGIRFPGTGNPAHDGMELQLLDDDHPKYAKLKAAQYTGSIYYQVAARRGATKPAGQWNRMEITARGPFITVVLNGQTITQADIDRYTKAQGPYKPLADRPRVGYVGLQSHGTRVDFRNIELKDLTTSSETGLRYIDLAVGDGDVVPAGATVKVRYTARLANGTRFDGTDDEPVQLDLKSALPGIAEGVAGMRVGGRRQLIIPPKLGYGPRGAGKTVPPNATLVYDIQVLAVQAKP